MRDGAETFCGASPAICVVDGLLCARLIQLGVWCSGLPKHEVYELKLGHMSDVHIALLQTSRMARLLPNSPQ